MQSEIRSWRAARRATKPARAARTAATSTYLIPHGALELIFQGLVAAWAIEHIGDPMVACRSGNVRHPVRERTEPCSRAASMPQQRRTWRRSVTSDQVSGMGSELLS